MIAHLEGKVRERVGYELVVTCGGIGYAVTVMTPDYEPGETVELWIHSVTKETGTVLFGFASRAVRAEFIALLDVDGVGPKTAMAILAAGADPRNAAALRSVKGVGPKIAEKILDHFGVAA